MHNLSNFTLPRLDGTPQNLGEFVGKVVLVVNVASQCGLTPQYEGLETLQKTYGDKGFVVLGFPCNQFAGQEPGTSEEIAQFCSTTYGVSFPVFERIDVNGANAHPLYEWLKKSAPGLLGSEATTGRLEFPPVDPVPPTPIARYFSETGHSLKNQFLAYWQSHGGLLIFGYPISEPFQEGSYIVQYFQRNRFELHLEYSGTPYEVLLGLLGTDLARARGYIQ